MKMIQLMTYSIN